MCAHLCDSNSNFSLLWPGCPSCELAPMTNRTVTLLVLHCDWALTMLQHILLSLASLVLVLVLSFQRSLILCFVASCVHHVETVNTNQKELHDKKSHFRYGEFWIFAHFILFFSFQPVLEIFIFLLPKAFGWKCLLWCLTMNWQQQQQRLPFQHAWKYECTRQGAILIWSPSSLLLSDSSVLCVDMCVDVQRWARLHHFVS